MFICLNFTKDASYINNVTVRGPLGIIQKHIYKNILWSQWNNNISLGLKFLVLWNILFNNNFYNSLLISKKYLKIFFNDINKLIVGVSYGWFIGFNVFGRGFSFRLVQRGLKKYLKLKIGYSHFVFYVLPANVWIKVSKKKNNTLQARSCFQSKKLKKGRSLKKDKALSISNPMSIE